MQNIILAAAFMFVSSVAQLKAGAFESLQNQSAPFALEKVMTSMPVPAPVAMENLPLPGKKNAQINKIITPRSGTGPHGYTPSSLPPAVYYHFGGKKALVADALANTIPQDIWDTYIMGERTTFGLNPFRRGLYGAITLDTISGFGDWFITVHIRKECRTPEATVIISELPQNPAFNAWIKTTKHFEFDGRKDFIKECYRKTNPEFGYNRPYVADIANLDTDEGPCGRTINAFLEETHARMVLDEQWPDQDDLENNLAAPISWYMRDRGCIESIQGSENDIPAMFSGIEGLWDSGPEATRSAAVMLIESFAAAPETPRETDLKIVKTRAAASKIDWVFEDNTLPEFGPADFVPAAVDALLRCKNSGSAQGIQDFQADMRQTIAERERFYNEAKSFPEQINALTRAAINSARRLQVLCRS